MTQNYYEWTERYLNSNASDNEVDEDNIAPESIKDEQVDISSVINSVVGGDKVSVSYDTVDDAITIDTLALDRKEVENVVASPGRFARLNANLSWEYDTLSDIPNWETQSNGTSFSFGLVDRPRRIQVSTDGTDGGVNGQAGSPQLVTLESIGAFRITFKDVTFTANGQQGVYFGLSDQDFNDGMPSLGQSGNKMYFLLDTDTVNGEVVDSGSRSSDYTGSYSSGPKDYTIEYDGSEVRFYVDGVKEASISFNVNADFKPFISMRDSGASTTAETFEASQVTVEPLPEVLQ